MEFEHRLINPETKEQRKELFDIFSSIFAKRNEKEENLIENPC